MLIKQNQLFSEATALLDGLERFSLDEATIMPHQVNVIHNHRFGQDLVRLEPFLEYAQSNGIDDAGFALHRVCEANDVPRDSLAFLANEENLLADDELMETFSQMQEAGFPVYIAPISDGSPYYRRLLEAMSLDQAYDSYDESPNLIAYVNESIIDDAKDRISSAASTVKSKVTDAAGAVKDKVTGAAGAVRDKVTGAAGAVRDKVTGAAGAVRDKVSGGAKAIASKLASVRKEIAKKSSEMLKATGPAKVFIKRQIDKLKGAAQALKAKLVGAKNAIGDKISGAGKAVKDAAASVGQKFSSAADSVKSGVKGIGNKISGAASSVRDKASQGVDSIKAKFA